MSLRFRVDDFPGVKTEEFFKHNFENYKRFDACMQKYGISYVLGVVPAYVISTQLLWLKEQAHITIAMHGIAHGRDYFDEFHGKTYRDIENALHVMKDRFEALLETRVVDYIPPYNTISADTVLALSRLGFDNVYGGPETDDEIKNFIAIQGMNYIHSQPPLEYGRSDELVERGSVEYLERECVDREIYISLHWTWEYNIGLDYLDMYLSKLDKLWKKSV